MNINTAIFTLRMTNDPDALIMASDLSCNKEKYESNLLRLGYSLSVAQQGMVDFCEKVIAHLDEGIFTVLVNYEDVLESLARSCEKRMASAA